MTNSLRLSIAVDRSLAWADGSSVRYIVATLEGESAEPRPSRPAPPVNLALVIDASGSMSGDKLDNAKRAARGVAERLREGDVSVHRQLRLRCRCPCRRHGDRLR